MIDRDTNRLIHILKKPFKLRFKADIDYLNEFTHSLDFFQNKFEPNEIEKVRRKCCKTFKYEFYKAG